MAWHGLKRLRRNERAPGESRVLRKRFNRPISLPGLTVRQNYPLNLPPLIHYAGMIEAGVIGRTDRLQSVCRFTAHSWDFRDLLLLVVRSRE